MEEKNLAKREDENDFNWKPEEGEVGSVAWLEQGSR